MHPLNEWGLPRNRCRSPRPSLSQKSIASELCRGVPGFKRPSFGKGLGKVAKSERALSGLARFLQDVELSHCSLSAVYW